MTGVDDYLAKAPPGPKGCTCKPGMSFFEIAKCFRCGEIKFCLDHNVAERYLDSVVEYKAQVVDLKEDKTKLIEALQGYHDFFMARVHWVAPIHRERLAELKALAQTTLNGVKK